MGRIDHQYTEHPAMGARQMVDYLKGEGFHVGRKLVCRLMALMDKGNLSAEEPEQGRLDQIPDAVPAAKAGHHPSEPRVAY